MGQRASRSASSARKWLPVVAAIVFGGLPAAVCAQDAATKFEEQYQAEKDPVRGAKLLAKLAPLQLGRARAYLQVDDEDPAVAVLEHYRDEVRQTTIALNSTGVSAKKHPAGFKELQIALRESVRRLDDMIFSLPVDSRPKFEVVRSDLSATESLLFETLFPTSGKSGKKE